MCAPAQALLCHASQLGGSIRALAAKGDLTFAAVNNVIVECKRVHRFVGLYAPGISKTTAPQTYLVA